jgi:Creatinase/Prolidase N-terminal domain
MRRGLMGWNPDELPQAALDARRARLQAAMARDNLDALVLYTNIVRPSAVCWLTGFTPYWIESLLLLPRDGATLLATALSKRVSDWVRATSRMEDIVNTPKPGTAIGARLAAWGAQRVGVLELDALPAGLYDDIVAAAPAARLVDASALFAAERRQIDAAERGLLARADALALAALAQTDPAAVGDAGALAGLVEKHARLGAAEEAYVAIAGDLDRDRRLVPVARPVALAQRFAVRASVAYKGSWVRRTQSFARDAAGAQAYVRAVAWLDGVATSIEAGHPLAAQLAARLEQLPGTELKGFMAESSIGTYPLEVVAAPGTRGDYAPPAGSFMVLTIELNLGGMPWLGATPVMVASAAN